MWDTGFVLTQAAKNPDTQLKSYLVRKALSQCNSEADLSFLKLATLRLTASCHVCSAPAAQHLHYGAICCYRWKCQSFILNSLLEVFWKRFYLQLSSLLQTVWWSQICLHSGDWWLTQSSILIIISIIWKLKKFLLQHCEIFIKSFCLNPNQRVTPTALLTLGADETVKAVGRSQFVRQSSSW